MRRNPGRIGRLLDHHQMLRTIQESMANRKLDLENVRVIAEWTIHGERAHFSIIFPPEEHFIVGTVGNEDEMRFRIEVFNSVDGSCRLMVIAGWLRFVCTNGLIIGTALMQLRSARNPKQPPSRRRTEPNGHRPVMEPTPRYQRDL